MTPGPRPSTRPVAERIEVTGIVQGVGFRPFVHRLATDLGLTGLVGNDTAKVFIEVSGPTIALDEFASRLVREAPPLARVDHVVRTPTTPTADASHDGFVIVESRRVGGGRTLVSPDVAVCDDCVRELFDPADRRFRHPFITCTNCGPRFTIIRALPYDRPNTTMAGFPLCEACAAEYRDPTDRRHHAQPIACHDCGPTLEFRDRQRGCTGDDAIGATADVLVSGGTVAVKGLGGFHLACDATSDDAVALLRRRKARPDKPFAVMVPSLEMAAELAWLDRAAIAELTSPARPVVLVRARPGSGLSAQVAPGNPMVGIFLPYTPVHHLLFDALATPLVMTSGNRSREPIVYRDVDVSRLDDLCDAFLTHDRPIEVPCDDSVVRVVDGHVLPVRRARGYAPIPVPMPGARRPVLAVGGELKNTFCVAADDHAWVSQHIGDMENLETLTAFDATVAQYRSMYSVTPDVVAADAHPGYLSSRWAASNHPRSVLRVHHHHAHVAAVMAEHQLDPDAAVIGIAFDGTGYGDDGTIWGGEVLVADAAGYERVGHLRPVLLPGGDAAIAHPCRVALSHLHATGVDWTADLAPVRALDDTELANLRVQLEGGFACVPTSSMGRLFDAVASLLDLRHRISFEAQAAIELEIVAEAGGGERRYRFAIEEGVVDARPVVADIVDDLRAGVPNETIAWCFHDAVADVVVELARSIRADRGLDTVALAGGVFQNALLTTMCTTRLADDGFTPAAHRLVPPNDGGLSLGQAFIAAHRPDGGSVVGTGRRGRRVDPTQEV